VARAFHSRNTYVEIDGDDLSKYFNNLSITDVNDEVEVTGFTDTTKQYVSGFPEVAATAAGNYGDDDGAAGVASVLQALKDSGDEVNLVYGPAGNGAGKVKLTYDLKVMSFDKTSAIGGAVTFSSRWRLSNPAVGDFS
jgi:hypothetical protein